MRNSTIIKQNMALEAIKLNMGRVRPALKSVGVGKSQFYQWRKDNEAFEKRYLETLKQNKAQLTSKLALLLKKDNPEDYLRLLRDLARKQQAKFNCQKTT